MPRKIAMKRIPLPKGHPSAKKQRNRNGPEIPRAEGGKNRTEGEWERDLAFISELYVRGKTLYQITEELNNKFYKNNPFSRSSVEGDVMLIRARWQNKYTNEIHQLKLEELGKIDKIESEYWNEWYRSKDPRYIQGIHWCVTKRCELLGLNAPIETNSNVKLISTTHVYLPDNGRGDGPAVDSDKTDSTTKD